MDCRIFPSDMEKIQTLYKIISQNKMFLLPTYPIFFQHVIGNRLFFLFGLIASRFLLLFSSPFLSFMINAAAHLCRSYPCPGSIAMTAFLHASRFVWALGRVGVVSNRSALGPSTSVWAFLEVSSLPPSLIVVTYFATFVSYLLNTWPHQERRFWVTYVVITDFVICGPLCKNTIFI